MVASLGTENHPVNTKKALVGKTLDGTSAWEGVTPRPGRLSPIFDLRLCAPGVLPL